MDVAASTSGNVRAGHATHALPVQRVAPIVIALIEDNRLLREGLSAMLRRLPEFRILLASANVAATLLAMSADPPHVVLLDVGLVDDDSLAVAEQLRAADPEVRVILMGLRALEEDIAAYIRAGVSGFVMKEASFDDLVSTINTIAQGGQVLPGALTHTLFTEIVRGEFALDQATIDEGVRLTTRERTIVDLLGQGMSNKAIAAHLHIAIHTVKSHVHNILEKLSLSSRLEVAAFAHASRKPRAEAPDRG